jgi:hypothetical protein
MGSATILRGRRSRGIPSPAQPVLPQITISPKHKPAFDFAALLFQSAEAIWEPMAALRPRMAVEGRLWLRRSARVSLVGVTEV